MKHRSPKVLYFSLIPFRISSFWDWVDKNGYKYCKNALFRQADVPYTFTHTADLLMFLTQYDDNLQSLHIIIDYESIKESEDKDIIRNLIIEFPEVQFLFDKQYAANLSVSDFLFSDLDLDEDIKKDHNKKLFKYLFPDMKEGSKNSQNSDFLKNIWNRILNFLFPNLEEGSKNNQNSDLLENIWKKIDENVDYSLVEVYLRDPSNIYDPKMTFERIICGYDNTFDASNLRYAIKFRKYLYLKVHNSRNFNKIQDSRFQKLTICVEEESKQNIFISYSMYANGYRVLPITTKQELENVNKPHFKLPHDGMDGIIIRDYDLQFEDENQSSVDAIRGFRYCDYKDLEEGSTFYDQKKKYIKKDKKNPDKEKRYRQGWNDWTYIYEGDTNHYWDRLIEKGYPIYYVTKGPKSSKIIHPEHGGKSFISDDRQTLYLSGFAKPVCGLYSPFQLFPEVNTTYNGTRYSVSDSEYEMITSRENHDHSAPLDVYDMANRMIRRADLYYNNKKYLLAALVSGEAMEILNGFHHRLMIKAYYIQAIAENAISMDVVGANERFLAKDAQFRVEKIKKDVERFYYGYEEISSRNVLNHIFSTCRQFCKDHEHFESEEVFLSAMGHLLEGLPITKLFKRIFKRS